MKGEALKAKVGELKFRSMLRKLSTIELEEVYRVVLDVYNKRKKEIGKVRNTK